MERIPEHLVSNQLRATSRLTETFANQTILHPVALVVLLIMAAATLAAIHEEVDRNPERSGAILRREGLYSSHLSAWRKQREEGALPALEKKRGPKGKSAEQVQIEKLAREKARLERELFKANAIIDAQKKLAEILGVDVPKITDPDPDKSE